MPFKSKAQAGYMFAHHPQMAKEFAAHTPSMKKLPEHVKKTKAPESKPQSPWIGMKTGSEK